MNSREAINEFYDRISWADQCKEITFEDRLICLSRRAVYLPIAWQDFREGVETVSRASAYYKLRPALLITGDAPHKSVEEIWWASYKSVHCVWIEIEQELWATDLTVRALEGINWNQSFKEGRAIY